jgi:hypothetical protein
MAMARTLFDLLVLTALVLGLAGFGLVMAMYQSTPAWRSALGGVDPWREPFGSHLERVAQDANWMSLGRTAHLDNERIWQVEAVQ